MSLAPSTEAPGGERVQRAFVLAAGLGTRLRPLTEELPKPAWPLFDVPLAGHVLRMLDEAGVRNAIVNLHHLPERLVAALEPWIPSSMAVAWSPEPVILGTGGALTAWKRELGTGAFFLCNADTYQELDLRLLARFHRERGGVATLALRESPSPKAPLEVDGDGRIVRFLSARAPGAGPGVPCEFTGVHLLEPEVLAEVPSRPCCINVDVHARLVAAGARLYGYRPAAGAYWSDLGTPSRYLGAHRNLLSSGTLPPGTPGRLWKLDGVTEEGGAVRAPSYLGPGALIGAGARVGPFAVVGAGARIGPGVVLEDAVLWAGAEPVPPELRHSVLSASGCALGLEEPPRGS